MNFHKVRNPYVGLRPFETEDSPLFYGRKQQISEILQKLSENRFLAVVGSSGCGKSSLIRAGLIPHLNAGFLVEERDQWCIVTMKPGNKPVCSLAESINKSVFEEADHRVFYKKIREEGIPFLMKKFYHYFQKTDANILILVDQFEEIFRFTDDGAYNEQADFISIILSITKRKNLPIYVVLTMRSDFIGSCDRFYDLPEALNESQYLLPRMTHKQLKQAIEIPAALYEGQIHKSLVQKLLNDINAYSDEYKKYALRTNIDDHKDQLPLLQHMMRRIWDNKLQSKNLYIKKNNRIEITLADYDKVGGLKKALTDHANRIYNQFNNEQKEIIRKIFCCLVDPKEHGIHTRKPSVIKNISKITGTNEEVIIEIIKNFKNKGFLANTESGELNRESVIDITHESLIRQWDRLKNWIDDELTSIEKLKHLEVRAKDYSDNRGEPLSGIDYKENSEFLDKNKKTNEWARQYKIDLDTIERFMKSSKKKWARKLRQRRINKGIVITILILAFVLSLYFNYVLNTTKQMFELTANSIDTHDRDASLSFRLAEKSLSYEETFLAKRALGKSLEYPLHNSLTNHDGDINSVEFFKEGNYIISSSNKSANVWDVNKGTLLKSYNAENSEIKKAVLSPDGNFLLTVTDNKVNLFHLESKEFLRSFKGHKKQVFDAAFSPDGNYLLTGSYNKTVKIWETKSSRCIKTINNFTSYVKDVMFSSDGKLIGIRTYDHRFSLWKNYLSDPKKILDKKNIQYANFSIHDKKILITVSNSSNKYVANIWSIHRQPKQICRLIGHDGYIYKASFSPDRKHVATASYDRTARIWDINTGELKSILTDNSGRVINTKFFNNGKRIITVSGDNKSCIWQVETGLLLYTLNGHKDDITCIDLSPNNQNIVTGSKDQTVRIWSLPDAGKQRYNLSAHKKIITSFCYSNNDKYISTASNDKTVRIWDYKQGKEIQEFKGHNGYVLFSTFSADGKNLISVSDDNTARIWSIEQKKLLYTLKGHLKSVISADFSPDSRYVITGSNDKSVRKWSVDSGDCIKIFKKNKNKIKKVKYSHNGKFFITVDESNIYILNDINSDIFTIKIEYDNDYEILDAKISHNDKYILASLVNKTKNDNIILIWKVKNGTVYGKFQWHKEKINSIAFSSDDEFIISASNDKTVGVWKINHTWSFFHIWPLSYIWPCYNNKKPDKIFKGHTDIINYAEFSPDNNKYILSASEDKTIRIWDVNIGKELYLFKAHNDSIKYAKYSPNGNFIASISNNNNLRIWPANCKMILEAVKDHKIRGIVRNMTKEEKKEFFGVDY